MGAFGNSNFNRIHVHAALQSFAENGAGVFVFVYLLKSGIAVPLVFLSITIVLVSRYALRQLVLPCVRQIGLKKVFLAGIALEALSFLLLPMVKGATPVLLSYLVLSAWGGSFYWTCLHAYIALLGDDAHRGAQISAKEALRTVAAIIAPFATGLLLVWSGPWAAFGGAAFVLAASALPLIGADDPAILANAAVDPGDCRVREA